MYQKSKAVVLVLAIVALTGHISFAQSADEAAIKAVIRAETSAFYGRNADAWESTWLHDAKATRVFVSSSGYNSLTGWENFGPQEMKWIKENSKPDPAEFVYDNYIIHTSGNIAWVQYDQVTTTKVADSSYKWVSREDRALIKKDDKWKIVSQITFGTESYGSGPQAIEDGLNGTGYKLLEAGKVQEATEVFELNVKLYPKSWNVYDSLGEAYAKAGKKDLAIENYKKSVEMNPKNDNGIKALVTLQK